MRKTKKIKQDEFICFVDLLLLEESTKDDEEQMVIECMAMFFNVVLPTTSSILAAMFHIIKDKVEKQRVMDEINYLVEGADLEQDSQQASREGNEPLNLPDPMTNERLTAGAV